MSGTSLDGIDVAITTLSKTGNFHFIVGHTFPFPKKLQLQLRLLIANPHCDLQELGSIDVALGQLIGQSINQLLISQQLTAKDITAIGSHGQTLFHFPSGDFPFSLQIGNAHVIAEMTGISTVADFRQRDIVAEGQGAPLVPAFHQDLFRDVSENRVIVNIGGISNITVLPASSTQPIIGFDTGPGNVLMDHWVQRHLKQSYDEQGQWAASGKCNATLLSIFLDEPYFSAPVPKSTGRELFNEEWLSKKLDHFNQDISDADIQATLLELTVQSLENAIKTHTNTGSGIYICGGGAHNTQLLHRLQSILNDMKVTTTMVLGLHPDWVEACAFAWLAYRTITKQTGNLMAVTGAKHPAVLGAIYSR